MLCCISDAGCSTGLYTMFVMFVFLMSCYVSDAGCSIEIYIMFM